MARDYSGLGPIVAKQLNLLAEARKNGKAITDQQQQHHHPQPHHQHPRQHQQHHRYPLQHHQYSQQQQQHHQHPRKPRQHQHQLAGLHREDTSFLGAGTAIGRPIHL
ncbi:G-box-binding factor-like [Papaver somniferum]|uniref:G-box-binding factor-like n=1 Tax=Papaver somniferum TaxID=3469 RepID=UPI000E6FB678|nr:G-box-binding factor-like [Papaver somniferum]